MNEIYVSIDVEADGPIPGMNSMLSLGAAAFRIGPWEDECVDSFSVNLKPLPDAKPDPDTMKWWQRFPEAYAHATQQPQDPVDAMTDFVNWVTQLSTESNMKPVAVAYPAGFDWTFVYWYLMRFVGRSPFGFTCLDMKSYAMPILGTNFSNTTKKVFPADWKRPDMPHTHVAVDDAIEQGWMFMRMLRSR